MKYCPKCKKWILVGGNFCSECGLLLITPQSEETKMQLIKIAVREFFEKGIHQECIVSDVTGYDSRPGESCPKCQLNGLTVLCKIRAILE